MQIILFILIVAIVLVVVVVAMIGVNVMRLVMWFKGLFHREQPNVYGDSRSPSDSSNSRTSSEPRVIQDDEGEYVDFVEVKE